mgnify:CR=1 FL=1|jgi:hypothetical protein
MLRLLLMKLWPVFIPIIIYIIWHFFIMPNLKTKQAHLKARAIYLTIIATIFAGIFSLLLFFYSETKNPATTYQPASLNGEKINPAILK